MAADIVLLLAQKYYALRLNAFVMHIGHRCMQLHATVLCTYVQYILL